MKKKLLKVLAMSLSALIVLTSGNNLSLVYAEGSGYDTTAPVVNSFVADADSFVAGENATFTVNMTEEQTGISDASFCVHPVGHSDVNDQMFIHANVLGSESLTGNYTITFAIPENALNGQWVMDWYKIVDVQGNENMKGLDESEQVLFNVVSSNLDGDAPVVSSISVNDTEVSAGDTIHFTVNATDATGISSIDLGLMNENHQNDITSTRYARLSVPEEKKNDGSYEITYTVAEDDFAGAWGISSIIVKDIYNNTYVQSFELSQYAFTVLGENDDTEFPVPTSIDISSETIIAPGIGRMTVSGTDSDSSSVSISVQIQNLENGQAQFVRAYADVVDGTFTASTDIVLNKYTAAGTWTANWIQITDSGNNKTVASPMENGLWGSWDNQTGYSVTGNKELHVANDLNIELHVGTSNPNLASLIENMSDTGVALINVDNTTLSETLFTAIDGTNKTLVFDMDGVQWIFNGKDIITENIKDIDISTAIETIDGTEYGYDSNVVALEFAENGVLPAKVSVRLKSDYISNRYNLNSSLYLAFIKSTADDEEEGTKPVPDDSAKEDTSDTDDNQNSDIYIGDESTVTDEIIDSIDEINENPISLVQIENAGITFEDDNYVTISMTHNSSYILSDKLPTLKKVVTDPKPGDIKDPSKINTNKNNGGANTSDRPKETNTESPQMSDINYEGYKILLISGLCLVAGTCFVYVKKKEKR